MHFHVTSRNAPSGSTHESAAGVCVCVCVCVRVCVGVCAYGCTSMLLVGMLLCVRRMTALCVCVCLCAEFVTLSSSMRRQLCPPVLIVGTLLRVRHIIALCVCVYVRGCVCVCV